MKFAIFVEGQTELITVREFLLREFNYVISLECRTLFKSGELKKTEYDFFNPETHVHCQIVNVGNDNAVLSRILSREKHIWSAGYEKIIGLRDMYSKAYREKSCNIDPEVNQKFIEGAIETVRNKSFCPEKIVICFAIMEVEAWFLGMYHMFARLDDRLTCEYIKEQLSLDLEAVNPETEFFHPANQIEKIYRLAGKSYDKHKSDIEAIASYLTVEDYTNLLTSDKCNSFNHFYATIAVEEQALTNENAVSTSLNVRYSRH